MSKIYVIPSKLTLICNHHTSFVSRVRAQTHLIVTLLLIPILLTGCMIPTNYKSRYVQPDSLNLDELAVVNFYRPESSFFAFGSGRDIDMYIDGNLVGELATGDSVSVNVKPGVHKITTGSWKSGSKLPVSYYTENNEGGISHNFLKGKQYYIRWKDPSLTKMFNTDESNYSEYFLKLTSEEAYNERK
ncbi:MAG: hypothetical protein ACI9N9_001975 [Enterobacterales bacterium]|jgi:hypothetical protein